MLIIDVVYLVAVMLLAFYGMNALLSVVLYAVHSKEPSHALTFRETPAVTVQLPIYNEMYVLERLLEGSPTCGTRASISTFSSSTIPRTRPPTWRIDW